MSDNSNIVRFVTLVADKSETDSVKSHGKHHVVDEFDENISIQVYRCVVPHRGTLINA